MNLLFIQLVKQLRFRLSVAVNGTSTGSGISFEKKKAVAVTTAKKKDGEDTKHKTRTKNSLVLVFRHHPSTVHLKHQFLTAAGNRHRNPLAILRC